MNRTLPVGLGARAYDVVVGGGLLDATGVLCAPFLKRGRLYHRYPDGTETPVSKEEMLRVAGMIYP